MNKQRRESWQEYLDEPMPTRQLLARTKLRERHATNKWRAINRRPARLLTKKRVKLV